MENLPNIDIAIDINLLFNIINKLYNKGEISMNKILKNSITISLIIIMFLINFTFLDFSKVEAASNDEIWKISDLPYSNKFVDLKTNGRKLDYCIR